jgi:hypothetical protein
MTNLSLTRNVDVISAALIKAGHTCSSPMREIGYRFLQMVGLE